MQVLHIDKTTHPCKLCPKVYKNRDSLNVHVRAVHVDPKHSCSLCEKAYKNPKNLRVRPGSRQIFQRKELQ